MPSRDRWAGGVAWAGVGALVSLGFAAILSIGVLLLFAGAVLGVALGMRQVPGWPGVLFGVSAAFVVLGVASLPWQACPETTPTIVVQPGETERYECGGVHPAVWLAIALAAGAAGLGATRSARTIEK